MLLARSQSRLSVTTMTLQSSNRFLKINLKQTEFVFHAQRERPTFLGNLECDDRSRIGRIHAKIRPVLMMVPSTNKRPFILSGFVHRKAPLIPRLGRRIKTIDLIEIVVPSLAKYADLIPSKAQQISDATANVSMDTSGSRRSLWMAEHFKQCIDRIRRIGSEKR